jgi:hypothetical protein
MALAIGLGVAVLTSTGSASAQWFDSPFGHSGYGGYDGAYGGYGGYRGDGNYSGYGYPYGTGMRARRSAPVGPYYQRPKRKAVETTQKEETVKPPPGPLLIAISLNHQRLTLYSGGTPVAHSPVSTGTAGHLTPSGIFSVIGKERFHRSNLYSAAPMPFMQRITWSGVALHEGLLPGYPASHGCIRMPASFARYLWATTRMGARVIITHDEVTPFDIAHAKLFAPPRTDEEPSADLGPSNLGLKVALTDNPIKSDAPKPAAADAQLGNAGAPPLQGLDSRIPNVPANKARSGPTASELQRAAAAGELSDRIDAQDPSPTAFDAATTGEPADSANKPGRTVATEAKEKPRMNDPVSVFVSRKTGRLYVRQGFEPVFEAPVIIRDPDVPLGTHLYTAADYTEDRSAMRWVAVTLTVHPASEPETRRHEMRRDRDDGERIARAETTAQLAAAAALDRVEMPKEAVERICDLLSPGASLIISDYPLSDETGKYTDFIILTR